MLRKMLFPILFFLLLVPLFSKEPKLKLIKEIGSEEDNYIFFRISGAVLSRNRDIYVVDFKGHCISRYNWSGKFIKKLGTRGQGPNELNGPGFLDTYEGKLYFFDGRNFRIAETDLELKALKFYRIHDGFPFVNNFFVAGKNTVIGNAFSHQEKSKSHFIKVLNVESRDVKTFFHHIPIGSNKEYAGVSAQMMIKRFFLGPRFGIHRETNKLVASFIYPDNPIEFFVYTMDGKYIDSFLYKIESKYTFPYHHLKSFGTFPSVSYVPRVTSVLIHKNRYIIFVKKIKYKKRYPVDQESFCLIYDGKTNTLEHRFPVAKHLTGLFISKEGYLLASKGYQDTPTLLIYKLDL